MSNSVSKASQPAGEAVRRPAQIDCFELPTFAPERLDGVVGAFQSAAPCALGQGWLKNLEPDFGPGTVRVGWRGDSLLVFAELEDRDIWTQAGRHNQRFWELGDVFEIFLRPVSMERYVELQVTPNNYRLQLGYADAATVDRLRQLGTIDSVLIPGQAFESWTWVDAERQRWFVLAQIPVGTVCPGAKLLAGSEWRFSFSRYDYTRGRSEPVISSTSPHPVANFHRQQDWGTLRFRNGKAA